MTGSDTGAVERFGRRDWMAAAVVFAVSLALRIPLRSQFAYHWDSAQFALAIEHFNMALSLPHRPGYILFVMAGRLVNVFVGDPHTSLLWITIASGAAIAALGYLLGATLFGRNCGWIAAGILATSPLCWFQSEVVFSTMLDAVLVMATVLVCWRAIHRGGTWPWVFAAAAALALEAGVRQTTTPTLCPLWIYTFWKLPRPRWRKFLVGVTVAGLLCAAWFIPMAELSGGIIAYWRLYPARLKMDAPLSPWVGGIPILLQNIAFIVANCWYGLLGAALLAAAETYSWWRQERAKRAAVARWREPVWFLTVWIVPMVAFGILVYTVMPGYLIVYFPGLAILTAWPLTRIAHRHRYGLPMVIAGITLINTAVFLAPPAKTAWLRANLPHTASHLREHDRQLAAWFQAIRATYHPDDVLICHVGQSYFWGFRQFEYHLPEYGNWLLTTDSGLPPPLNQKLWLARNRDVQFHDRFDPGRAKTLILVVPIGETVEMFAKVFDVRHVTRWDIPGSAPLYTLPVSAE